jgi:hypothetical protein
LQLADIGLNGAHCIQRPAALTGSKGVYYLRCSYVDGNVPTVNIAVDKFTDVARNFNVISVVANDDTASGGANKFKVTFT